MLTTEFFEDYPLYRKYRVQLPEKVSDLEIPAVNLFCPVCNSQNTFTGTIMLTGPKHRNNPHPTQQKMHLIAGRIIVSPFVCASCKDYHQFYVLYVDDNLSFVIKVGQYPSWSVSVEKNLSKILKHHEIIYRKGLVCESQGYGIGAYAYYRRIVENVIDDLLTSIHELLNDNEKAVFDAALKEAQESTVAKDKIALVKDLLPATLRPDNMNPLSLLHDVLSIGIHTLSDEECLEVASDVRQILTYLVEQIHLAEQANESSRRFTESMRNLLEKRALKNTQGTA